MPSRLSSKTLTALRLEGKAKKQGLPPLPLCSSSLERENVRFSVSVAAAVVGGGGIQPPTQECRVRRAFPAITRRRRGRGWRANGFNYHSDWSTGLRGPELATAWDRLTPSQLGLGTLTLYAALGRSSEADGWASQDSRGSQGVGVAVLSREAGSKGHREEQRGVLPEAASELSVRKAGPRTQQGGAGAMDWTCRLGVPFGGAPTPLPVPSHPRQP